MAVEQSTRRDTERLIARVADGDGDAFDALYAATSGRLFAVCLSILRERAEAEEALQEVYVRIWRCAGRYVANGLSPMTWLITIARNRAIDRLRARDGRPAAAALDAAGELPDIRPGPEAVAIHESEAARLRDCLDTLGDDQAAAVRAVYLEGLTYAELSRRRNVPEATLRSWMRRGLINLRACVSP